MKKNIGIISVLIILGIGLGYLAYKTNIQEEETISLQSPTTPISSGLQNTGTFLSGETQTKTGIDTYKNIRLELVNDIRSRNTKNNYCSEQIGDVESLAKDIASYTGKTIDNLTIKDACGKQREFASSINNKDIKDVTLKQENNKYIIYSLIDNNRDLAYTEYPIIIYDKILKTNTLLTISYRISKITYLNDEGYFILKIGGYEDGDTTQFVFRINESKMLGTFNIPFMDCGDQGVLDQENNKIILHNFNEDNCTYDSESRDLKNESKILGNLTYKGDTILLGKFNKDSKLYRTNEDIIEGAKNNTVIFHIDAIKYELKDNILIKK